MTFLFKIARLVELIGDSYIHWLKCYKGACVSMLLTYSSWCKTKNCTIAKPSDS